MSEGNTFKKLATRYKFSRGPICFLFLTFFYTVVKMLQKRKWSFFLMLIVANSIAAYFIADGGVRSFIANSLNVHLARNMTRFLDSLI